MLVSGPSSSVDGMMDFSGLLRNATNSQLKPSKGRMLPALEGRPVGAVSSLRVSEPPPTYEKP